MGFFDFLHKRDSEDSGPKIHRGFRGEGILYSYRGKSIELDFTWCNGDRLFTETIRSWKSGQSLTESEKATVFIEVLRYLSRPLRRTIVVINPDDDSAGLWESLSAGHAWLIKNIEYWSTKDQRQFERKMYLEDLKRQGTLSINDIEIHDEKELDQVLERLNQKEFHSS
jgi:hypothetical protein